MADAIKKAKFKIGQKVWYIANGYVTSDIVKGMFVDKWDDIILSFQSSEFTENKYCFQNGNTISQDNAYTTKEALIKYIKEEVNDEE